MTETLNPIIQIFINQEIQRYGIYVVLILVFVIFVCLVLGKMGLDAKFQEQQSKFNLRIDSTFNRLSKLHDIEFGMLPKLWNDLSMAQRKLEEIYYRTLQLKPIENCTDVSLERLNEFLAQAAFSEEEKARVRNVEYSYRFHAYQKLKLEKAHQDAKTPLLSFYENYTSNKIFIGDKLRSSIEGLIETMSLVYAWLGEGGKTDLPAKSYNQEYEIRYAAMRDAFKNIDRDFRILLYPSENLDHQKND
ncbi:MAG: hypothetical protein IPI58_04870 [Alphaproteobacteria bacterium]|nr:MAG: hypothetical protein IPI58_04870 [Alphaproteobacteria bacterium]